MTTQDSSAPVRPAGLRRFARVVALLPLALPLIAAPAFATAPDTWANQPAVSPLHALLLLGGVPLALIVVITLLVVVPSMMRGETYQPGLAWRNEPEWFGGPRGGLEALDEHGEGQTAIEGRQHREDAVAADERGGASARW